MVEQVAGVAFPGEDRSSTDLARRVVGDATRPLDPSLARDMEADEAWYRTYVDHHRRLEEAEVADPTGAAEVPATGLASFHDRVVWSERDHDRPLAAALGDHEPRPLRTTTVRGTGEQERVARVPYRGQDVAGDDLRRLLDDMVVRDVVEPSAAEAVHRVLDEPDWLDASDLTVVVFGGSSEMGPLGWLARWGARTLVVDLPGAQRWRQIVEYVRTGSGTASVPSDELLAGPDAVVGGAGVDLLTGTPRVARWLEEQLADVTGPVVLGNYVYAPGSAYVLVTAAVDALTARVLEARPDAAVAALATPTDVYAVPRAAVEAGTRKFEERGALHRLGGLLPGGQVLVPNRVVPGDGPSVVDCQIPQQGPNYALSKRVHRWRARQARADGHRVSMNVAPATRTRSVTDRRLLAAAYGGADRFGVEVFEPSTSRALMALLLLHDLRADGHASDPTTELAHPLDLLSEQACHSGLWRLPYEPRSVLPIAAGAGLFRRSTWR